MKKAAFFTFFASISLCAVNLHADDQTASVQQELKDQGFYYGQVDGQPGGETTAAIRRYQIRNGLQVTGALTQETVNSLKGAIAARAAAGAPATTAEAANLPPQPAPLDNQPQQQTAQPPSSPPQQQDVSASDREFLRKQNVTQTTPPAPAPAPAQTDDNSNAAPPPPAAAPQPQPQAPPLAAQYASLFVRTPYQNAPFELQQNTLRNAQAQLARQTYYNGEIDGIPGPETSRAITAFQSDEGFAQTGRLDLETLSGLRLLPNTAPAAVQRRVIIQPFYPPPRYYLPPRRVYRGIWVD